MSKPPVIIDLETRSACDLRVEGGFRYAKHETTRLLTVAWTEDLGDSYHVWFPGAEQIPVDYAAVHLPNVTIHTKGSGDGAVPADLCRVMNRPWVGHNAWTFDRQVWQECAEGQPVQWYDTYPMALSVSLPGGLNKIGQMLWGEGKYEDGGKALKKASVATGLQDCEPDNVPIGQQLLVAKYNVQDVRLTVALYKKLLHECHIPESEMAVMAAHDAINTRGVRIDRAFVKALIALSDQAKARAVDQIASLTDNALPDLSALQSRNRVFAWLDTMGVSIGDSLGKDIVARFIDAHKQDDEDEQITFGSEQEDKAAKDMALVIKVLELRMQALRITGGKLEAALQVLDTDDRARGLFVYHGAHTGRWAARKIQPHNMPRPKEGVDTWKLCKHFDSHGSLDYDAVEAMLPKRTHLTRFLSVDDAASGLLRSMFVPDEGKVLAAADLAGIEARVLAWLAGERAAMQMFWDGGDPYMLMAEKICGPKELWPNPEGLPYKKHSYRQLVGKVPHLACGYQGGPAAVGNYCGAMGFNMTDFGITEKECVDAYRRMHPAIAGEEKWFTDVKGQTRNYFRGGYWDQLNDAAILAIERGGPVPVGCVDFQMEGENLICVLPSQRRLTYRKAHLRTVRVFDRDRPVVYYTNPRYGVVPMYGGKFSENVVQAVSRDILAHGMVLCEREGLPVCLHVHDEPPASILPEQFDTYMRCVTTPPEWLTNFPLDAEGSMMIRYAKATMPGQKEVVYRNGRPK